MSLFYPNRCSKFTSKKYTDGTNDLKVYKKDAFS